MIRQLLRAVAAPAAAAPIEAITTFFVLVTLVYFQLLHAIEGSEFFTLPDHSATPAVPSTYYAPTLHLSTPSNPTNKWTQISDLDNTDIFSSSSPLSGLENVLVQRFIVAGGSNTESTSLDEKLKALRLIVDVKEGTTVGYEDVCYKSPSSSSDCLDVPVETTSTRSSASTAESEDVVVTFLLRDDTLGRKYLDTLRELQHVTLGVDATSSIVLSVIPLSTGLFSSPSASSSSVLSSGLGAGRSDERLGGESVFSLYPYSSLSIFTRTNNDVFTPSQRRAYRQQQQQQQQQHHAHLPFPSSSSSAQEHGSGLPMTPPNSASHIPGTETNPARHIKFLAYALRALVTRFWMLAKNADSADIFVVLLGYVLMHFTFVRLFLNMRKMGSSFWLPSATLISSTFGFLLAIFSAYLLSFPVDLISLSEALPFLVITVGFDKPFLLARAVFNNPEIAPVRAPLAAPVPDLSGEKFIAKAKAALEKKERAKKSGAHSQQGGTEHDETTPQPNGFANDLDLSALDRELAVHARIQREIAEAKDRSIRWAAPIGAKFIVIDAVKKVGTGIVRDYAIEVAVLCLGGASGIGGLKEFCHLAALILVMDCVCLFTFYIAILTVMVEVHRIKIARKLTPSTTTRRGSFFDAPTSSVTPSSSSGLIPVSPVKEDTTSSASSSPTSLLFRPSEWKNALIGQKGSNLNENISDLAKKRSPAGKLKLTLIIAFLVLHVANLCTPLTEHTAVKRNVAPTEPLPVNKDLAWVQKHGSIFGVDAKVTLEILPAIHAIAFASNPTSQSVDLGMGLPLEFNRSKGMASLDHFMSGWTSLVGDPVLSKWIVVALFVSILLNGYLMKGIASGSAPSQSTGPVAVAAAAARLVGAGGVWDSTSMNRDSLRNRRRWSGGIQLERFSNTRQTDSDEEGGASHQHKLDHIKHADPVTHKSRGASAGSTPVPKTGKTGDDIRSGEATPRSDGGKPRPDPKAEVGRLVVNDTPRVPYPTTIITNTDANDDDDNSSIELRSTHIGRRSLEECWEIYAGGLGAFDLSDEEVILLVEKGKIPGYGLEKGLKDLERAVKIRRAVMSRASVTRTLEASDLPMANYDYSRIIGACCENVVGYMPIPVGIAGPLNIDGISTHIPMATTEGTLVASTSRGCKALNSGGGVTTVLHKDGMTRGPAVEFGSLQEAASAKIWIEEGDGFKVLKAAFESTSRFAKLISLKCALAGRTLYIRFTLRTGDAMGMNMAGKASNASLDALCEQFPTAKILALSGNYCTDKKPAAINWIEGRGKSVVAEAIIPGSVVKSVLKTDVKTLVNLNWKKNLMGSAMAGSIGGFNAHASNILTAMFLATGQDPAQNVESSMCMTLMEAVNDDQDLMISCSMPCIEVGTVGGGTILGPQFAMLEFLGVAGAHPTEPGANARRLARIICAAVMAGELSLMSALAANQLISAHLKFNRSTAATPVSHTPGAMTPALTPLKKASATLAPMST